MGENLRRKGKRIVALMLAMIMVLTGLRIGGSTAKAADTTVTITGFQQAKQWDDGHWGVWLKVDSTLPDGAYSKPDVEVNGSAYTGGLQVLKDGAFLLIVFWNYTETLAEGTSFGIKAGTVTHSEGNLTIANNYTVEYKNGAWAERVERTDLTILGVNQAVQQSDGHW